MFPTAHPDISGHLADERAAGLRTAAARYRAGRPALARWRPARFVEPSDLSRVVPTPVTETPHVATSTSSSSPSSSKAGRAA